MTQLGAQNPQNSQKKQKNLPRLERLLVHSLLQPLIVPSTSPSSKQQPLATTKEAAHVLFLPNVAWCNEDGAVFACVQAWIYQRKSRKRLKEILARLLRIDLETLDEATQQIFYARMRLFVANSTSAYELSILDEQGNRHKLPPTGSDGRTGKIIQLEQFPKSGNRFSDKNCDENKKLEQFALSGNRGWDKNGSNTQERELFPQNVQRVSKISFQLADYENTKESNRSTQLPLVANNKAWCFLVPEQGCSVISDIDDTIKHSFVRDKKKMLRTAFLEEFQPVAEMSEWYEELAQTQQAAFHYVSSSPIQLYPALSEFMQAASYPEGSIHLREATRWSEILPRLGSSRQHKRSTIAWLLHHFPKRQFILIGDSGGDDAFIYAEFAKNHPQQITAVCIRCISETLNKQIYDKIFAPLPPHRWLVSHRVSEMRQFIATSKDFTQ